MVQYLPIASVHKGQVTKAEEKSVTRKKRRKGKTDHLLPYDRDRLAVQDCGVRLACEIVDSVV